MPCNMGSHHTISIQFLFKCYLMSQVYGNWGCNHPSANLVWHLQLFMFTLTFQSIHSTTDPEEFPALLDHVCQAMSGSQVLIQVSLVRLSQVLLPVHHPLIDKEGKRQVDTIWLVTASIIHIIEGIGNKSKNRFAVLHLMNRLLSYLTQNMFLH